MNELDEVCKIQQISRIYYGCELKPCDWVVWNDERQLWIETDEHFRNRIRNEIQIP
jgi:hypothetical protein